MSLFRVAERASLSNLSNGRIKKGKKKVRGGKKCPFQVVIQLADDANGPVHFQTLDTPKARSLGKCTVEDCHGRTSHPLSKCSWVDKASGF